MYSNRLDFNLGIPDLENPKFIFIKNYSYENNNLFVSLYFQEGGLHELKELEKKLLEKKYSDFSHSELNLFLLEYFFLLFYKASSETPESKKQHILSEVYLKNFWFTAYKDDREFPNLLVKLDNHVLSTVNANEEFKGAGPSYEYFFERFLSKLETSYSNIFFGGNKRNSSSYQVDLREMEYSYNDQKEGHLKEFIKNNTNANIKILPKIQISLMIASLAARIESNNYLVNKSETNLQENTMEVASKILPLALDFLNKEWTWIISPDTMVFPFSKQPVIEIAQNINSVDSKQMMFPISPRILLVAHDKHKLLRIKAEEFNLEEIIEKYGHGLYYSRVLNDQEAKNFMEFIVEDYLSSIQEGYMKQNIPIYYNIHMKLPVINLGNGVFDGSQSWFYNQYTAYKKHYTDEKYFVKDLYTRDLKEL